MKGIILAGGSGTRLNPATIGISKQLIPIYDKPMIYYPLSILMLAEIREILIITTPHEQDTFKRLLGDGSNWGIKIQYKAQPSPDGLAQAFILAEDFLEGDLACLILGDNIYYGHGLVNELKAARSYIEHNSGACVFGYWVKNPQRYGVMELNHDDKVVSITEKPKQPKSNYAITGLYFYDQNVCEYAKQVKPSWRGELEITDLNNIYLKKNQLTAKKLGKGYAWLDAGTFESMMEASQFIATIENRQGLKIACLEEIAWRQNWIDDNMLEQAGHKMSKSCYGQYILDIIQEDLTPNHMNTTITQQKKTKPEKIPEKIPEKTIDYI